MHILDEEMIKNIVFERVEESIWQNDKYKSPTYNKSQVHGSLTSFNKELLNLKK